MRTTILASILLAGSFAVPASAAPEYPWCQRTVVTNGTPDCAFTNVNQCEASISGVGGDCIRNPRLAYDEMTAVPPQAKRHWHR